MEILESIKNLKSRIEKIVPQLAQDASRIIVYIIKLYGVEHMIHLSICSDDDLKKNTFKLLDIINLMVKIFISQAFADDSFFQNCKPYQGFESKKPTLRERSLKSKNGNLDSELYSTNLIHFPKKDCYYFNKGFCKYGNKCKFFHSNESVGNMNIHGRDDQLENNLMQLLISRDGDPISIDSLPMAYYKKFHRTLQDERYLIKSQTQSKVGCNLIMILGRLKNICLIERPDGRHYVMLKPQTSTYVRDQSKRRIYLTFPAETTFSENDVFDYFKKYGDVEDVSIPSTGKRTFGYVTFKNPFVVQKLLSMKISHIICGTSVRVKRYNENAKLNDRKHLEKPSRAMLYNSSHFDGYIDFQTLAVPRGGFMEQNKSALDQRWTALFESQFLSRTSTTLQCFANSIDELGLAQEFWTSKPFDFTLNNLNNAFSSEDNFRIGSTNHNGQESNQVPGLLDNPCWTTLPNNQVLRLGLF